MSKQSDAKERQQYTPKFIPGTCGNCSRFSCDIALPSWMQRQNVVAESEGKAPRWDIKYYGQEGNKRCTFGGFAVKEAGSCNEWSGIDKSAQA